MKDSKTTAAGIEIDVHEIGLSSIPLELRNRLITDVRPVRLTIILKLLSALNDLQKIDPEIIQGILENERKDGAPMKGGNTEATQEDIDAHETMLKGIEAVLQVIPIARAFGAVVKEQADKYRKPGEECDCANCVANRAAEAAAAGAEGKPEGEAAPDAAAN